MDSEAGLVAAARVSDPVYEEFLRAVQARFTANVGDAPVFTTDVEGLFEVYLGALPEEERQHHNCNTCRTFFDRYGGLVTITGDGQKDPALWSVVDLNEVPALYRDAVGELRAAVRRAKVTGVFLSPEVVWGRPVTGPWRHLAVAPPSRLIYRTQKLTAAQAAAEKLEDFRTLSRALGEFRQDHIAQAVSILRTEALYRSEKCLGAAEWLGQIHARRVDLRGPARDNALWLAVAQAPAGFCHPRSSMIGTLLEDISSGMPFEQVKRRFDEKMHPAKYQRPQAPPAAGNIAAAEKLFEKLGLAPALRRRYARLEEVEALWRPPAPKAAQPTGGGVFSHLTPKGKAPDVPPISQPPVTMTWEKFRRAVLPTAERIEYAVEPGNQNFTAFLTAADPAAPPILQWDREERRNPVSWYVIIGGTPPVRWGLQAFENRPVTAVTLMPSMWGAEGAGEHHGKGVVFLLEGAKDSRWTGAGVALFPEILKAELREVRATIEAHSRSATLEGAEDASACGIALQAGSVRWTARFRVYAGGIATFYHLDRWD